MNDFIASLIRTIVPVIVGAVVAPLTRNFPGLQGLLDEQSAIAWLTPICIGLYYTGVRALERKFPAFGWLLGLRKQPAYVPSEFEYSTGSSSTTGTVAVPRADSTIQEQVAAVSQTDNELSVEDALTVPQPPQDPDWTPEVGPNP